MSAATEPAWMRYADDPDALTRIIAGHYDSMRRDPANAEWYRRDIAEISARLQRIAA